MVGSPQTDDGPGNITLFEFKPDHASDDTSGTGAGTSGWTYAEIDPPELWSVCPLMTSLNGILYFVGDDSRHLQSFDPIKRQFGD